MWLKRVLLALSVLAAVPALAQSASAKKQAGAHYQRGVGLFKEGDYGAALAEFRAAYDAVPSWEVLYNIGLTERRLFKYGSAVQTLHRYLKEGGKRVPQDRRDSVEKELEQIRQLTSKVTVTVEGAPALLSVDGEPYGKSPLEEPVLLGPGKHTFKAERGADEVAEASLELVSGTAREVVLTPKPPQDLKPVLITIESQPPGAVLTVDGKLAGVAPTQVELKPGGHEVVAENDGYQPARSEFVVTAGQARKVTVTMVAAGASAAGYSSGPRRFPLAGAIITGSGLAAAGAGIGLAFASQGASKQVSDFYRTGGVWDAKWVATEATGQRAQTWSYVLVTTGSIAVLTGAIVTVVSLLSPADEEYSEESSFFLAPDAQGGATVGWTVRF